jgi:hypothetical protein
MPAKIECEICGNKFYKKYMHPTDVYDNPFEDESRVIWVCESCDEDGHLYDHYEYCEDCDRYVAVTASNGMRGYIRFTDDERTVCVACMQEDWLENGMPKEVFESDGNKLDGDFFDYSDLEKYGFKKFKSYSYGMGYTSNHGYDDIQKCKTQALDLIEKGFSVIIDIEASGMGLGGYFGLWYREIVGYKVVHNYSGKLYSYNYYITDDDRLNGLLESGETIEYKLHEAVIPVLGGPLCLFKTLESAQDFAKDSDEMSIYKCTYTPSISQAVWHNEHSPIESIKWLESLCGCPVILADSITLLYKVV